MNDGQRCPAALLLIDFINYFAYPGAEELLANTKAIVENVLALRERADEAEVPVIYVNDNFGRWRSSFRETVEQCLESKGADIVRQLRPRERDFFILKPHRSGFYQTPLDQLLTLLGTERLILSGITTDMCVLATASDARVRNFELWVPRDACACISEGRQQRSLALLAEACDADTVSVTEIDCAALASPAE